MKIIKQPNLSLSHIKQLWKCAVWEPCFGTEKCWSVHFGGGGRFEKVHSLYNGRHLVQQGHLLRYLALE